MEPAFLVCKSSLEDCTDPDTFEEATVPIQLLFKDKIAQKNVYGL